MIRLTCTNCNALLTIDEAFAGGVCRCQHCGTIQTVPSSADLASAHATGGKKLFETKVRADGTQGSGLDALAEIVASSGLTGSGLSAPAPSTKSRKYTIPPRNNLMVPLLITAVVIIVLLLILVAYLSTRGGSGVHVQPPPNTPTAPSAAQLEPAHPAAASPAPGIETPQPKPKRSPQFLGQTFSQPSVVYLIDSSMAGKDTFEPMVQACFRSIESLEPNQKFQIITWHSTVDFAYPKTGLIAATPVNVKAAENQLKDIYMSGPSDVAPSLKKALESHPAVIFLVSGKMLQRQFADVVLTEVGDDASVIIHCFALGQEDSSGALQKIAEQTHGEYRVATAEDLSLYSQSPP